MISPITVLYALCALAPLAAAHGVLDRISIDGELYQGNRPGGKNPSVIRPTSSDYGPTNINSPDMACGNGAQPASLTAEARPGSKVSFQWMAGTSGPWFHGVGPMNAYMAECAGSCDKFDSSKAKWFKVAEAGQSKGGANLWYQNLITSVSGGNGGAHTITLPKNLPSGNYLLRHEIIAIHNPPAEFYAGCAQISIKGGASKRGISSVVSPNELVSFPGAYKSTDSGVVDPPFTEPFIYKWPGPKLSKIAVRGGSAITKALPAGAGGKNGAKSPSLVSSEVITQIKDVYGDDSQGTEEVDPEPVSVPSPSPAKTPVASTKAATSTVSSKAASTPAATPTPTTTKKNTSSTSTNSAVIETPTNGPKKCSSKKRSIARKRAAAEAETVAQALADALAAKAAKEAQDAQDAEDLKEAQAAVDLWNTQLQAEADALEAKENTKEKRSKTDMWNQTPANVRVGLAAANAARAYHARTEGVHHHAHKRATRGMRHSS